MTSFFNTLLHGNVNVPSDAKALLIVIHGMAEHCARYNKVIAQLNAAGIATCCYDHRGHGLSVGATEIRGDVAAFDNFVTDAVAVIDGVRRQNPQLPIFIWGHSMGAIIATLAADAYVTQRPRGLRGVITTSPPIAAFDNIPRFVLRMLKVLSRIIPRHALALPFKTERLSRDPQIGSDYLADPLIPKTVTLRLLVGLATASARCLQVARKLTMPWLAMHGSDDQVAPPIGSQRLFDALRSDDKEILLWPGARHEVHNETEPTRTQCIDKIVAWIKQRSG